MQTSLRLPTPLCTNTDLTSSPPVTYYFTMEQTFPNSEVVACGFPSTFPVLRTRRFTLTCHKCHYENNNPRQQSVHNLTSPYKPHFPRSDEYDHKNLTVCVSCRHRTCSLCLYRLYIRGWRCWACDTVNSRWVRPDYMRQVGMWRCIKCSYDRTEGGCEVDWWEVAKRSVFYSPWELAERARKTTVYVEAMLGVYKGPVERCQGVRTAYRDWGEL